MCWTDGLDETFPLWLSVIHLRIIKTEVERLPRLVAAAGHRVPAVIPLRERESMRFSLTKPDTRGRALILEGTSLQWTGLRWEPEGRVLSVPDDVWDHPVVPARQLNLSIIDPLKLGQELFVQHLVWSVRDVVLFWEPVVGIRQTGREVLYEQREEQLSLV